MAISTNWKLLPVNRNIVPKISKLVKLGFRKISARLTARITKPRCDHNNSFGHLTLRGLAPPTWASASCAAAKGQKS